MREKHDELVKKKPKRRRQWMNRFSTTKTSKKATMEDNQNFWRRHQGRSYLDTPKGNMLKKRRDKRRAKNKVAKTSRKRNRVRN